MKRRINAYARHPAASESWDDTLDMRVIHCASATERHIYICGSTLTFSAVSLSGRTILKSIQYFYDAFANAFH